MGPTSSAPPPLVSAPPPPPPQVLLLRHQGWGLHGSDQRHCSGSRGQHRVHHWLGPRAAQGENPAILAPSSPTLAYLTPLPSRAGDRTQESWPTMCVPVPCQVPQSLKWALQLSVTGISLSWDLPSGIQAELLHWDPEVIFAGQRCLVYAQLRGQPQPPDIPMGGITLQYRIQDQT
ncbi:unnamed protein product [Caretta caretta]